MRWSCHLHLQPPPLKRGIFHTRSDTSSHLTTTILPLQETTQSAKPIAGTGHSGLIPTCASPSIPTSGHPGASWEPQSLSEPEYHLYIHQVIKTKNNALCVPCLSWREDSKTPLEGGKPGKNTFFLGPKFFFLRQDLAV